MGWRPDANTPVHVDSTAGAWPRELCPKLKPCAGNDLPLGALLTTSLA